MPETPSDIGHFMIGVGGVIELRDTGKILVIYRKSDFQTDIWELVYGRMDQFEEVPEALKREVLEETGITDLQILRLLRISHFYRGPQSADTDIHCMSFHMRTETEELTLNDEHTSYKWVTPEEALTLIPIEGIRNDIKQFQKLQQSPKTFQPIFTGTDDQVTLSFDP